MDASFCIETIKAALAKIGKPEIFNTDQGCQFTFTAFTDVLKQADVQISMDGNGAWRDNVFVERLRRTMKYEEVYLKAYDSACAARKSIARFLTFDNSIRPLTERHPTKLTSTCRQQSRWRHDQ